MAERYYVSGYLPPSGIDSKDKVRQVQQQLNAQGANLKVDGIWGAKTQAAYSGSSGSSIPTQMQAYMKELSELFAPSVISYTPQSTSELRKEISSYLWPAYEQAIRQRQEATDTYQANLDADAYARGMGASTYLTDVKYRQQQEEADDISDLYAEYTASLAKQLMDAQNMQTQRELEIAQYNNEQTDAARRFVYETAYGLYQNALAQAKQTQKSSRSSSSSGSGKKRVTSEENCELFLSLLTPQERGLIYNPQTDADRQYQQELIDSLGALGYMQMQQKYPAA